MPEGSFLQRRKLVWSLVLVSLIVAIVLPGPRQLLFHNPLLLSLDSTAEKYIDDSLVRASAAFVLARTINAIVSVFEESELQLEPGGVGVSIALGEVLDPVNDMVERFSWVMLVSVTSLGIQKVLIEIGPWVSVEIVLLLGLLILLAGLWLGPRLPLSLTRVGGTLILFALLLRLALPLMAYLNNQAYEAFLDGRYRASTALVEARVTELQQIESAAAESGAGEAGQETGWWAGVREIFERGKTLVDIRGPLEAIRAIAFDLFNQLVDLIVVFVLHTLLLPLLFLWGVLKLGRLLVGQEFGRRLERFLYRQAEGRG